MLWEGPRRDVHNSRRCSLIPQQSPPQPHAAQHGPTLLLKRAGLLPNAPAPPGGFQSFPPRRKARSPPH